MVKVSLTQRFVANPPIFLLPQSPRCDITARMQPEFLTTPSGHRIAAIEEKQVLLEFNGVRTPLIF